ncbi:MAG: chalcone isomerase [Bacteroidota bacterium]|nr:chalcone isomerase [Bacteroidota bacterium]
MKLAGIELPQKISLNNKELTLNGAAIRTKFFIQTYIISLYSETPIRDEKTAIESKVERSLRMQIITPLATSKAVSENIQNGMKEGLGNLYHQQQKPLEEMRSVIEKSGVQYKDTIDIYYSPSGELKLYKNEREIYSNKDGKLFAETIFNMYVGKKPKDSKIKQALLKG